MSLPVTLRRFLTVRPYLKNQMKSAMNAIGRSVEVLMEENASHVTCLLKDVRNAHLISLEFHQLV
jgi:hypothetical protein